MAEIQNKDCYWQMYADVWAFHKKYINGVCDDDFFWESVVSESGEMILSRLVDTFSSRILYPMLLLSGNHSSAAVLSWEEDLH